MFDTLAEYQWQTIQGTEWIDLTGKELLSGKLLNNSIDVSSLHQGIYLFKLEDQFIRFLKE